MPSQLLARARDLYVNDATTDRVYGLDGNVRIVRNEVNDNGVIEPAEGERVMIYFGMRRGGSDYFGLDVTDRNAPTLLFRIGPNEAGAKRLTNAGQSWSTPSVATVNISGATQNPLQPGARVRRRLRHRAGQRRLRARRQRQPDLHGRRRFGRRALVRRPVHGHRRGPRPRVDDPRHPGRRAHLRPDGRRLRRPHVRGRHGRPRLALRHPQRPGAREPRHRRRVCLARQRPPRRRTRRARRGGSTARPTSPSSATAARPGSTSRSARATAAIRSTSTRRTASTACGTTCRSRG